MINVFLFLLGIYLIVGIIYAFVTNARDSWIKEANADEFFSTVFTWPYVMFMEDEFFDVKDDAEGFGGCSGSPESKDSSDG